MCSFPNESLCLGLQWCTQAGYPWQIKPGLQCLCFVLLFLIPHFSKAVHASETANACFKTFRLPLWGTAAGPSYDSCLLVLTTSQDVTVWAVCSCHICEGKPEVEMYKEFNWPDFCKQLWLRQVHLPMTVGVYWPVQIMTRLHLLLLFGALEDLQWVHIYCIMNNLLSHK